MRIKLPIPFKKKNRNQWKSISDTYNNLMNWSWDEIQNNAPDYFARLNPILENTHGETLEIGAGIGNVTRWLSASNKISKIIAIDGFEEAIDYLKKQKLPKVFPYKLLVDKISFEDNYQFDFVILTELIEHIYLKEEKEMLKRISQHLKPKCKFIISTPIGWLDDPHHVRGFGKNEFIKHLERYYGSILMLDYRSGYSQLAIVEKR